MMKSKHNNVDENLLGLREERKKFKTLIIERETNNSTPYTHTNTHYTRNFYLMNENLLLIDKNMNYKRFHLWCCKLNLDFIMLLKRRSTFIFVSTHFYRVRSLGQTKSWKKCAAIRKTKENSTSYLEEKVILEEYKGKCFPKMTTVFDIVSVAERSDLFCNFGTHCKTQIQVGMKAILWVLDQG